MIQEAEQSGVAYRSTVGSKQRPGAKKFSSNYDKIFLSKGFLIISIYAFCSALNALPYEILFNFFTSNVTEKIRD